MTRYLGVTDLQRLLGEIGAQTMLADLAGFPIAGLERDEWSSKV